MTKEEAKDFLFDMFNLIGATAVEHWTEKDAKNMRRAVLTIENESAQPERMRGKWIKDTGLHSCEREWMPYKCSECGKSLLNRLDRPNYCPNCGAVMDSEDDERRELVDILKVLPYVKEIMEEDAAKEDTL